MLRFLSNTKTIKEIYDMFDAGALYIDQSYQRRAVWSEKDNVRLIETILLQYVIPELFFWKASIDPDTGNSITHVVDGQQRVKAIYSFINNDFCLKPQYLINEEIKKLYGNKYFKDLPANPVRTDFWSYELLIVDIDSRANRENIIEMFNRLNLTDYNLNNQEKRNSRSGEFSILATEISNNSFWTENKLFSISDIKRMKDIEFCATIILLYKNGIIDQSDQSALNEAYEEYYVNYQDAENDKNALLAAMSLIQENFINKETIKFIKKKSQLYTIFSIVFYMKREKLGISEEIINNFVLFVQLYLLFNNALDFSDLLDDDEKILYDWLKRYKLASSEGLNKHTNRMIRFNVMKDFLFNITNNQKKARSTLYEKIKNNYSEENQAFNSDEE